MRNTTILSLLLIIFSLPVFGQTDYSENIPLEKLAFDSIGMMEEHFTDCQVVLYPDEEDDVHFTRCSFEMTDGKITGEAHYSIFFESINAIKKYEYDKHDRIVKAAYFERPLEPAITLFSYNKNGQLLKEETFKRMLVGTWDDPSTMYAWDQRDLVTYHYDQKGQLVKKIARDDPSDSYTIFTTTFTYDTLGRKTSQQVIYEFVMDGKLAWEEVRELTTYSYFEDSLVAESNITAQRKTFKKTETTIFNDLDQVVSVKLILRNLESDEQLKISDEITYDNLGRPVMKQRTNNERSLHFDFHYKDDRVGDFGKTDFYKLPIDLFPSH